MTGTSSIGEGSTGAYDVYQNVNEEQKPDSSEKVEEKGAETKDSKNPIGTIISKVAPKSPLSSVAKTAQGIKKAFMVKV